MLFLEGETVLSVAGMPEIELHKGDGDGASGRSLRMENQRTLPDPYRRAALSRYTGIPPTAYRINVRNGESFSPGRLSPGTNPRMAEWLQ